MTKQEAETLFETNWWKEISHRERAEFQLWEDRLCMPFDVFHEAVEKSLDRPVWTHEFASWTLLQREFLGEREPPTMQNIINLIPADKR